MKIYEGSRCYSNHKVNSLISTSELEAAKQFDEKSKNGSFPFFTPQSNYANLESNHNKLFKIFQPKNGFTKKMDSKMRRTKLSPGQAFLRIRRFFSDIVA